MKKIFKTRTLALILVLAMAVSLFTISASAATSWSLTGHGTNVASITIDGADFYEPDYTTSTNVYINSNTTGSYEKTSDVNVVRVILQEGTSAPYIAIIKF